VVATLTPEGKVVKEQRLNRDVLLAYLKNPNPDAIQKSTVVARYTATLWERKLQPGKGKDPVAPLPDDERIKYVTVTPLTNWLDLNFILWVFQEGLTRRDKESDIEFAKRVHKYIFDHYTYTPTPTGWQLTDLIKVRASDCGGLSNLFVGVLRMNGVPARIRVGFRLNQPPVPGPHCKAEFYARGVGWVPTSPSDAVEYKGRADKGDKAAKQVLHDQDDFFGTDTGRTLILHLDTDLLLDTKRFPPANVEWLQFFAHYVYGTGESKGEKYSEGWTFVSRKPPP